MASESTEITMVLSGGSDNLTPTGSLGGDPSFQRVLDKVNNLFPDNTDTQIASGYTDYRCIYIFNESSEPLYDAKVFISSKTDDDATVFLGISEPATDIQRILVDNGALVSSGYFIISYDSTSVAVNHNSNYAIWAQNIADALNSISPLSGVICNPTVIGDDYSFEIQFLGLDNYKNHDTIQIVGNLLVGSDSITVTKVVEGGPINTIAVETGFATNPPSGVTFLFPLEDDPLDIGTIFPDEGFPLWVQRSIIKGADFSASSFSIRVEGTPVQF